MTRINSMFSSLSNLQTNRTNQKSYQNLILIAFFIGIYFSTIVFVNRYSSRRLLIRSVGSKSPEIEPS